MSISREYVWEVLQIHATVGPQPQLPLAVQTVNVFSLVKYTDTWKLGCVCLTLAYICQAS